jgi:hypothetical protein
LIGGHAGEASLRSGSAFLPGNESLGSFERHLDGLIGRIEYERVLCWHQRRDRTRLIACVTLTQLFQNALIYNGDAAFLQLFAASFRALLDAGRHEDLVAGIRTHNRADIAADQNGAATAFTEAALQVQ